VSTIGYDHETARRVALGIQCAECDTSFVKAHQTPVACSFCYPKLSIEERRAVGRAIHEEETKEAFKQIARAKRARKENQ
jgi:hydrogenase maturation factor HypF (carbamoyltransferase family)